MTHKISHPYTERYVMVRYIFWPTQLRLVESNAGNDPLSAIAIKLRGTDYLVLDVVTKSALDNSKEVRHPYKVLAEKSSNGVWSYAEEDVAVMEFRAPNLKLMQFFSLDPITLVLPEYKNITGSNSNGGDSNHNARSENRDSYPQNILKIFNNVRYQTEDRKLRRTINLANLYYTHLTAFYESYPRLRPTKHSTDRQHFVPIYQRIMDTYPYRIFMRLLLHVVYIVCLCASHISSLLNWKPLPLVDFSATVQQIDLRLQELCYFPVQYLRINKNVELRRSIVHFRTYSEASDRLRKELPCKFYPDYIRMYNTVWLMVNDVSFGLIIGTFIHEHQEILVNTLSRVISTALYDTMKKITVFLASNPFGIKLNEELASFLSQLFLWTIEVSNHELISRLTNEENLNFFFTIVTKSMCLFGASFGLSLIIDFCSILSLHIYLFYRISSKLYYWQLNAIISLFYLFCGKKRNVLRNRIDYNYFELDELLMGTLLFIIATFLMPTILSFYFCYTVLWMTSILIDISLDSIIGLLNHFPLFALLLRIKDPRRLPGGVSIDFKGYTPNGPTFILKNNPLRLNILFKPFSNLMNGIKANYFSITTFKGIIAGKPVRNNRKELYKVLYSSLPAKPIKPGQVYDKLLDLIERPSESRRH